MAGEHTARSGALVATIISVKMEIDDDDRDVIETHVEISNETTIPMGQLEAVIETTEGTLFHSLDPITSIGPGLTRSFVFNFSLMGGEWTFKLWHDSSSGRRSLDLGPYHSDFELETKQMGRKPKTSMGEGLFGGAFDTGMGDFGRVSERELIDSRTIELIDYEAEHDIGGSTRINVSTNSDESFATLSQDTHSTPLEPLTTPTQEISTTPLEPSHDLLANPTTNLLTPSGPPESPPMGPPSAPPTAPLGPPDSPPMGPPSAPPSAPPQPGPSTPPSGPPDSPPMGPPSAPPSAPPQPGPSTPPSGPPESPPMGPPSAPPSAPPQPGPSGPPSGPPESPPMGPPSAPPSAPPHPGPSGPPSGPPDSPPMGPPSAPPSAPPHPGPSGPPSGPPSSPPEN